MIPRDFITEWRNVAPWVDDAQVEQDLVLSRAIIEIFRRSDQARSFAFRGGTALHKLFLPSPGRYSEDIDLVQIEPGPIGPILGDLRDALDGWLGEPKRIAREGRVVLQYRFESEGVPIRPMRLKIEINTREHFTLLGLEEREFSVASRWFTGRAVVRTYPIDELIGTKLRALFQRRKGRDLFDLWVCLQEGLVDPARVVKCMEGYLRHDGTTVSRAEFEANLQGKLADLRFASDIAPLLAPGIAWDPAVAGGMVMDRLVSRMKGSPWRGRE